MSQQPSYGEPQPEQQPYSYGAYPNPYQQGPQRPNHTTRNVLLIVGAVIVLVCGGTLGLGVLAFNNVRDAVDDALDDEYSGSRSDPLTVEEGAAFEIRGFTYDEGWAIENDENGYLSVGGLRGTNERDDEDPETVDLVFTLIRGNEVVGDINCNGPAEVAAGRSTTLACRSGESLVEFDEIEVHDTSYYE